MARSITEVAVALLARREHSVLELRRKLQQKGFEEADIEKVVGQLCANNLLSDERFAETYINMRRNRGYGPLRIQAELQERGISAELIDECIEWKNNQDWISVLETQYRKKYGNTIPDDYKEKAKQVGYLQRRGFPLEWVLSYLPLGG